VQFEMMSKNMRKPSLTTLEKIKTANYTLLYSEYSRVTKTWLEGISKDLLNEKDHDKVFERINGTEFYKIMLKSFNESPQKLGFVGWKSFLTPFSARIDCVDGFSSFYGSGTDDCDFINKQELFKSWNELVNKIKPFEGQMPLILKENYVSAPVGFLFSDKFHPFLQIGNEVIGWLLNGGILQHWKKFEENPMIQEIPEGPKVLLFDDLSFGFVLWLSACGISAAGLVLEYLWMGFKEIGINSRNYLRRNFIYCSFHSALKMRLKTVVL
jgi:hypothetical protein